MLNLRQLEPRISRMDMEYNISSFKRTTDQIASAIIAVVFEVVNIKHLKVIDSRIRSQWLMFPKAMSMYITYSNTDLSLFDTAKKLGSPMNHASVLNNVRRIQGLLDSKDERAISLYDQTRKILANDYSIFIDTSAKADYKNKPLTRHIKSLGAVKPLKKYSLTGEFICIYGSAEEAAKELSCSKQTIQSACNSGSSSFGYLWKYTDDDSELVIPKTKKRAVYQLDLDGEIIKGFVSATEASKEIGCNRQRISHACVSGSKFNGYRWRYISDNDYKPKLTKKEQREEMKSRQPIFSA